MTDLSQLRSLEQIAAERTRLEQRAAAQQRTLNHRLQGVQRLWQQRWARVQRMGNILSLFMPKISRGTLLTTLLVRLIRRFRR